MEVYLVIVDISPVAIKSTKEAAFEYGLELFAIRHPGVEPIYQKSINEANEETGMKLHASPAAGTPATVLIRYHQLDSACDHDKGIREAQVNARWYKEGLRE